MNTIFRIIIIFAVLVGLLNLIQVLVPAQMTDDINNSIVYFLSFINYLDPVVPVDTLFSALHIFMNFMVFMILFVVVMFIIHLIK